MSSLLRIALLALGLVTFGSVNAAPILRFDGTVTYYFNSGDPVGHLLVEGSIFGYEDVPAAAIGPLLGTTLRLEASFVTSATTADPFFPEVFGLFESSGAPYDLMVRQADSDPIIAGTIVGAGLRLQGLQGFDFGSLNAVISPAAGVGTLAGYFADPSTVMALVLNMSTPFTTTLFDSPFGGALGAGSGISFTSQADGTIETGQVPVPAAVWLLVSASGLLATRSRQR